jgi:hypothetical protein
MKQEDREKRMSEEENFNKSSPASPRAPESQSGRRHWLLAGVGMAAGLGGGALCMAKVSAKGRDERGSSKFLGSGV